MTSVQQDSWVELTAAMRLQLMKQIECIGAMKPDEVKALVEAGHALFWLEVNAAAFDKEIELKLAKVFAD